MSVFQNGFDLLGIASAYPVEFHYDGKLLTVKLAEEGTWKEQRKDREFIVKFEPRWFSVSDGSDRFPVAPYEDDPLSGLGLQSLREWSQRDGFDILFYDFDHYDHDFKVICIKPPIVEECSFSEQLKQNA